MSAKSISRFKIHKRIRKKISGTAERPRISIYRSNSEIYAQLINDEAGHTLLAASSRDLKDIKGTKIEKSKQVGVALAKMAADKGITTAVFDRGGFLYHGRVQAIAEGAREGGLQF
ncbi:50S ribosomal protein L18 [Bacteroidota bacterium]|nr:50S ribosomal protein L18 [Bacteroidota bacterium]